VGGVAAAERVVQEELGRCHWLSETPASYRRKGGCLYKKLFDLFFHFVNISLKRN
jgi:hypothetical protein